MQNKLRIIGGVWRSRQLRFTEVPGLRPTPGRVRETLFNWLQMDITGKNCLDLYAGSGALGFEAASRGAQSVIQVEANAQACRSLHENRQALSATQIRIVQMDVMQFLAGDAQAYDIVFLDPPFGQNLVPQTCLWLEQKGWLSPYSKIYLETERQFDPAGIPVGWQCLKSKTAGEVAYHLFQRNVFNE
ncbi:MAG: 16S rRNA (guanine(966)-N(2))-methyltransferase RsmD [Methylobacter sp.]|nr:MAG: 16S rRNA (guanine(966)-N(2))-methyltransferase RsmD [Methylobacter sp.]PPD20685.1 MAG: 16S rRNA (guanine(966)-N(2))-methyltransferase RsmD [Methylobacter sp.]PPD32460.1 MAG: 16S rRNA (guanine(966)-N(2))-methyltransferase RsmD [Methylomonas sp.]